MVDSVISDWMVRTTAGVCHICTCIACMHACMHAYIHAYTHTYTHTYIHTYKHTYIHAYTHTYTHTYIHTYIHTWLKPREVQAGTPHIKPCSCGTPKHHVCAPNSNTVAASEFHLGERPLPAILEISILAVESFVHSLGLSLNEEQKNQLHGLLKRPNQDPDDPTKRRKTGGIQTPPPGHCG